MAEGCCTGVRYKSSVRVKTTGRIQFSAFRISKINHSNAANGKRLQYTGDGRKLSLLLFIIFAVESK